MPIDILVVRRGGAGHADQIELCARVHRPPRRSRPLVAAGAGQGVAWHRTTNLKLWRIFNECASQYEGVTELGDTTDVCAVQQILANQWNAEHPDAQVETTSLVWPGIVELNAALAAGTPPDIFTLHAFRIPTYASKGVADAAHARTSRRRASTPTTCCRPSATR